MKLSYYVGLMICGLVLAVLCIILIGMKQKKQVIHPNLIDYTQDWSKVIQLFPKTVSDIDERVAYIKSRAQQEVDAIIAIPHDERTFENTVRALDAAGAVFNSHSSAIYVLGQVHPDTAIREAALAAKQEITNFSIELFAQNVELYHAFKAYVEGDTHKELLTQEQKYYLDESMKGFEKAGLHLPQETRDVIKKILKELNELSLEFQKNINEDSSNIIVTREELDGMDEDFISRLKKTEDGLCKLGVDYATIGPVFKYCAVADTRKRLSHAFNNRAYPRNKEVLERIMSLRDELAHILGFESYAAFNIDNEMAQNPRIVEQFLRDLIGKTEVKIAEEIECIKKETLPSIEFDTEGKLYSWDRNFALEYVKKKKYDVEERVIAEYFPMENTIKKLLSIYESFFNLTMKEESIAGAWHEEVKAITVYRNEQIIGYLLLDLHPRKNKFSHACEIGVVSGIKTGNTRTPTVAIVLANFTKSTPTKPSLLYREEVSTFFHEFGHAIHDVLGATELVGCAGTSVKTDFVEMPSQMLEEWLYDEEILKYVSSHYKTGESLPDDLINKIIQLKNFAMGNYITRQAFYALLSLKLYQDGSEKDIDQLYANLYEDVLTYLHYSPDHHMYASFGHLTGYGARYYGYLWSKVFALDLFNHIKSYGLMNPDIGTVYAAKILEKGGSTDPNKLLKDFLGRKPNQEAFLADLGLI